MFIHCNKNTYNFQITIIKVQFFFEKILSSFTDYCRAYCLAINTSQCIVFLFLSASKFQNPQKKTMCCDGSAYYEKAIKGTARHL